MNAKILGMLPQFGNPDEYTVKKIIASYGIDVPRSVLIRTGDEEFDLDFPLVIKVSDPKIMHKSDVGGVVLGINDSDQLHREISSMRSRFPESNIMVEEMEHKGLEIIVGLVNDANFGNTIMLGMGGVYTELYRDVVFRLTPIIERDAADMIDSVKIRDFEKGFRCIAVSREAIIKLLLRVSQISEDLGDNLEMLDLNPVIVNGDRIFAVDAKLVIRR
ncbi:hypothetical protein Thermo_01547 [Thermoplasmatales archaeon]|nr:hypothetical protein Thermo_01547 [Thermoplasmatales archaeon]